MKAIILAAGRGKRMQHLTNDVSKPMLQVLGKTLIEHKIASLPDHIDEVVLVVSYLADQITDYFGNEFLGKKISYVYQEQLDGTGGAILAAKDHVTEPVLVMMGDDLYGKEDVAQICEHICAMGVQPATAPFKAGKVVIEDNVLKDIDEAGGDVDDLVCTGLYVVPPEIFNHHMVDLGNGEYGLPQTLARVSVERPVVITTVNNWIRITAPEDIDDAEQQMCTDPWCL